MVLQAFITVNGKNILLPVVAVELKIGSTRFFYQMMVVLVDQVVVEETTVVLVMVVLQLEHLVIQVLQTNVTSPPVGWGNRWWNHIDMAMHQVMHMEHLEVVDIKAGHIELKWRC